MRWLMFAAIMVTLGIHNSASALIVSPNHFTIELPHNSTYENHFRISPENISVNVAVGYSSPFQINMNTTNLTLVTYHDMDFEVVIPERFIEGIYQSYIFITGENDTKIVTIEIEVEGEKIYVTEISKNITAKAGDVGYFMLNMRNTGNSEITVSFNTSSGIGKISSATSSLKLYPGISFDVPFTYEVDKNTVPDTYQSTININQDGTVRAIPVLITVLDGTLPVVDEAGFVDYEDDIIAGPDRLFWAKCSDNIGIKKVSVSVISDGFNDTFGMASRESRWETDLDLEFTGDTDFTVMCEDTHGNIANKTFIREVIPVQGCEISDIEFYSIKKDSVISKTIIDCDQEISFEAELRDFEYEPVRNANQSNFDLYLDDGNRRYDFSENDTITLEDVDLLKVGLKANESGFYSGKIRLNFPPWVHEDVTLDFSGKIGDLTVPETYIRPIGDGDLNCRANITEDERTSEWECLVKYPITTPLDQLAKPMTPARYQEINEVCSGKLSNKDVVVNQVRGEGAFYIAIIVITYLSLAGMYIFPNFAPPRFKKNLRFIFRR